LNSQNISKVHHLSPHSGIYTCQKAASLWTCPVEMRQTQLVFQCLISRSISVVLIFYTQLSMVRNLTYNISEFSAVVMVFELSNSGSCKKKVWCLFRNYRLMILLVGS